MQWYEQVLRNQKSERDRIAAEHQLELEKKKREKQVEKNLKIIENMQDRYRRK